MNWLTDLLKEFPALSVAKERLALVEEQRKNAEAEKVAMKEEVATLKAKVVDLEEKNADLRGEIVKLTMTADKFIEQDGVLWKRDQNGVVKPIAYCPKCKLAMRTRQIGRVDEVSCLQCKFTAPFKPYRLEQIATELNTMTTVQRSP